MKNTHTVIWIAFWCIAAGAHGPAAAQTDADIAAAGRACMTIESQALRLACFEGIFGVETAPPEPAVVTSRAAAAAPAAAPAAAATATAPAATAPAAVPAAAAAAALTVQEDAEIGTATPEIRIVEVREVRPGDARFMTDDGRVYFSTGRISRNARIPETPFNATLESGALGSQFLRFGPEDYERVRVSERD